MGTPVRTLVVLGMVATGWSAAAAGELTASPPSRNFGNRSVSAGPSASQTIVLDNSGSTTQVLALDRTGCNEFNISTTALPVTLGNGDSLTVTITYDPSDRTADTCVVTPAFGAPIGSGGQFTLTGDGIAPVLMVAPTTLNFAPQRWNGGAPENLVVNISNVGDEAITASNLTAAFMSSTTHFAAGAVVGLPIAAGGSGSVPVTFNPSSVGAKVNTLIISLNNDAPASPDGTVNVNGVGTQSIQTFSPTSLNVGAFDVGGNGTANMVIRNDPTATDHLTIASARITGSNAGDFAFTDHGCNGQGPCTPVVASPPIEVGDSETFAIRCAPSVTGTRTATLEITSDDPNGGTGNPGNPRTAALTCTGRSPEVTVSPTSLAFNTVRVGTPSVQMFTIINSNAPNTADLTYSVTEAITDVGITCAPHASCMGTLVPGAVATISVTFQPTAAGLRSGNIVVTTSDVDEGTVNVAMSGTGVESNLSSSTAPSFGNVPVALAGGSVQNATITNNGGASLNTTTMTITGDPAFSFAFPSGLCTSGTTCARVVTAAANGGTATIPIRCDPSSPGAKTATLNIQSDDPAPAGGTNVTLACTGTASAMAVTPPSLGFANQRVNTTSSTMSITVSNTGTATLNYAVTEPAGDQFIVTAGSVCNPTCTGLTVPAGMMATITVAFRPTTTGLKNGVVLIDDLDNFVTDVNVAVSGTGVEPVATLTTATPLTFGNVNVNQTSGQQVITVMNTGTMDLAISGVTHTEGQAGEDNFDFAGGPLGASTVAAGASLSWQVVCDPETRGNKTGTVTIANNSTNAPSIVVALTCLAQEGIIVVTASPLPVTGGNVIDFGIVRLNTAMMTTVTLTNPGNVDVTVASITLGSQTEGFSITAPSSMTLLANGASPRTFAVTFAPTLDTQGTTTLTIASDWNDPVVTLSGDGEPVGFSCALDQPFGDVPWDGTAARGVTLRNTGTASVQVENVVWLSGGAEFAAIPAGTGVGALASNQTRSFNLTAVPTDAMLGVRNAVLRVTTDLPAGMGNICDVMVSYTSVGPAVTLTPGMTVDFGAVDVDGGPVVIPLQVTNSGTGRMDITSVSALIAPFARTNFADVSIDPAQTETIMITFDPDVEGDANNRQTQLFTITTDGLFMGTAMQPPGIMIQVTGYGVDRHLAVADVTFPPTYRYPSAGQIATDTCGAGGGEACAIQICNRGGAPLDVTMIEDPDDAFDLASTDPVMVAGGSPASPTCVAVAVAFRPTAAGEFTSTVTLTNNDNDAPMAQLALSGTGILRDVVVPAEVIDLGRLPLGNHDLAELGVMVNNRSGDPFVIRELRPVASAPAFELLLGSGAALAPGDLPLSGTLRLDDAGQHEEQFDLYLDEDPEPYGRLTITVEGVEKENYYTCASGRPVELGGGLLAAMLAIALRGRRRRDEVRAGRAGRATARP